MDPARHRGRPTLSTLTTLKTTSPPSGGRWVYSVLLVVILGQLFVAFFPFRLDPPRPVDNDVTRTAGGGLRFGVHNKAETARPPTWLADAKAGSTVTIDLLVRAARNDPIGPARILTVSDGFYHGDLTIGQQRGDVTVRVRRPGADQTGWPDLFAPGALRETGWVPLRVVVAPDRVQISVDGRTVLDHATESQATERWNIGYRLALGNELGGGRPWAGEIRRAEVTVDGTTVDYLRPGALEVPDRFWYDTHRGWEPPLPRSPGAVLGGFAHLLLFIPVGVLLTAARPSRGLSPVVLVVAVLSVAICTAKILFAGRHPSLSDIAWETAGGALGAWVVWRRGRRTAGECR